MLEITLTPNRSDRPRYWRVIRYARHSNPDHCTPIGERDSDESCIVPWSAISPCEVDPNFQADWRAHVRAQEIRESAAPSLTRADLIARGMVTPCRTIAHLPSECVHA